MIRQMTLKACLIVALVALVSGCVRPTPQKDAPDPIGAFRLGHVVVVADQAQAGPLSRKADPDDWEAALSTALKDRFQNYQGAGLYHIAVKVDGYILAPPGVPVVAAPKSVAVLGVSIWDDAAGRKLNDEPKTITVIESLSGKSLVSSGLTMTSQEQMQDIAIRAAAQIQVWLEGNKDWF